MERKGTVKEKTVKNTQKKLFANLNLYNFAVDKPVRFWILFRPIRMWLLFNLNSTKNETIRSYLS